MDITINTPALLFPAISLVMLAYTNRFMALGNIVRKLHDEFLQNRENKILHLQIKNLQYRIRLVRRMQFFGVLSFLLAIVSMYLIYQEWMQSAHVIFAISIFLFALSLVFSLIEIQQSTKALELELSDIEEKKENAFVDFIKNKI